MNSACGNSANIEQIRILLAEILQIPYKQASFLRKFRKRRAKLNVICGNSAGIKQKCNIFAELPQARCRKKTYLCREQTLTNRNKINSSAYKRFKCYLV